MGQQIDVGSKLELGYALNGMFNHYYGQIIRWEEINGVVWFIIKADYDLNTHTTFPHNEIKRVSDRMLSTMDVMEVLDDDTYASCIEDAAGEAAMVDVHTTTSEGGIAEDISFLGNETTAAPVDTATDTDSVEFTTQEVPPIPIATTRVEGVRPIPMPGSLAEAIQRLANGSGFPELSGIRTPRRLGNSVEAEPQMAPPVAIVEPVRRDLELNRFRPEVEEMHEVILDHNPNRIHIGTEAMKNISMMAEVLPEDIFEMIDNSVVQIGHAVFDKMPAETREKMIEIKLNQIQGEIDIEAIPGKVYSLKYHDDPWFTVMCLGNDMWYPPYCIDQQLPNIEIGFKPGEVTKILHDEIKNLIIKELIDDSLITAIESEIAETTLSMDVVKTGHTVNYKCIRENALGENWVNLDSIGSGWINAINYHYINNGAFSEVVVGQFDKSVDIDGIMAATSGARVQSATASGGDLMLFKKFQDEACDQRQAV